METWLGGRSRPSSFRTPDRVKRTLALFAGGAAESDVDYYLFRLLVGKGWLLVANDASSNRRERQPRKLNLSNPVDFGRQKTNEGAAVDGLFG